MKITLHTNSCTESVLINARRDKSDPLAQRIWLSVKDGDGCYTLSFDREHPEGLDFEYQPSPPK